MCDRKLTGLMLLLFLTGGTLLIEVMARILHLMLG